MQVRSFVDVAYKRTLAMVEAKKDLITAMSEELLSKEVGGGRCRGRGKRGEGRIVEEKT